VVSVHQVIHEGPYVSAEIKTLTGNGRVLLVVNTAQGIVEDATEDGINKALGELNQVVIDIQNAQAALVKARQGFIENRRDGGR
jgi:hypothetical protein